MSCLPLLEQAWKFGVDDAGNPVHNKDMSSGKLLGLIQNPDGVFHVTYSVQQRDGRCVLGSQQSDGAQIQRLLRVGQARTEFLQSSRKELRALTLHVGVGVLPHQQKQELRILRRRNRVYGLQVIELRAT